MTKAGFISRLRAHRSAPEMTKQQAGVLADAFFGVIQQSITLDGRFSYPGFGTFHVKERRARPARNPRTNTVIQIPARKTVTFKAAPGLKSKLK